MPPPYITAARWLPSDDEATDCQKVMVGALVCQVQVTPKLVDVQGPPPDTAAK